MKKSQNTRRVIVALTVVCLALPQALWARSAVDESPSWGAMVGDLFIARPVGLVMTVGGAAAFVVSLPFTLLAGHAGEAAETLIVGPGASTFMRCLGCRETGYTYKDVDKNKHRDDYVDENS
jgi:hypothetical protein